MDEKSKDDSDDSQSTEEAGIDVKSLLNPLVIKTEESMVWDEIEQLKFDCYYDFIMCDLDPNSPPWEEDVQLDQMDKDVSDYAVMLPNTISQGSKHHYSYDNFMFFDTWEEQKKLLRKNSVWNSHCQNQLYFYQKYIRETKHN
jgi:hypothetical protein